MQLYDYFRSTASYRVRIALNWKSLTYSKQEIHLINQGGQQHHPAYVAINPQHLVPTLKEGDCVLTQSLAIIEYLEEKYPTPPLLPKSSKDRALVRGLALSIACDLHPLNNLRVLQYLQQELQVNEEQKLKWYRHWIKCGFEAIEQQLQNTSRNLPVCFGDAVTMADILLIPQVYNANRFNCPMDDYPLINEINEYCLSLKAFKEAAP